MTETATITLIYLDKNGHKWTATAPISSRQVDYSFLWQHLRRALTKAVEELHTAGEIPHPPSP